MNDKFVCPGCGQQVGIAMCQYSYGNIYSVASHDIVVPGTTDEYRYYSVRCPWSGQRLRDHR